MTARADAARELEQMREHLSFCSLLSVEAHQTHASMKVTAIELNCMYECHMAFNHNDVSMATTKWDVRVAIPLCEEHKKLLRPTMPSITHFRSCRCVVAGCNEKAAYCGYVRL